MSSGRDDDALSWAGDDDPTLEPSVPASTDAPAHDRADRAARGADSGTGASSTPQDAAPSGAVADDSDGSPGLSSAALIALGVLGGVYLLYTIGWLVGGLRVQTVAGLLVSSTVSVPALVLAVAAPVVWFVTAYALTRNRATWLRFTWLAAGAVLLVPWPFSMLGIGG